MELSDVKNVEINPMKQSSELRELLLRLRDPNKTPSDYVIEQVEPRRGKSLRYIHAEVDGVPCYIISAKRGERALLMCLCDYDHVKYHRLHTSEVEDVIESVDGKTVIILTHNTSYTLKRTNFSDSFRGVQKFGDELSYVLP